MPTVPVIRILCCGCEDELVDKDVTGIWLGKATGDRCVSGEFASGPVWHVPMPGGLRGAPR